MSTTTTLRCPACMRDVPAGSMFCPRDGSPLDRVTSRMGVPEAAAAPAAKTAHATGFPWKWVGAGAAVALRPGPGPGNQREDRASARLAPEPPRQDGPSAPAPFEQDALLARLAHLAQRLATAGGSPSPLAGKGLAALRTRTEAARTLSERKALVVAMDIWERDFLRR